MGKIFVEWKVIFKSIYNIVENKSLFIFIVLDMFKFLCSGNMVFLVSFELRVIWWRFVYFFCYFIFWK